MGGGEEEAPAKWPWSQAGACTHSPCGLLPGRGLITEPGVTRGSGSQLWGQAGYSCPRCLSCMAACDPDRVHGPQEF